MWASDRRRQLLDVATQVAAESGTEALRVETIAKAAGVSRPVVYYHFGDREALLIALIEDYGEFLEERMPAAFEGTPSDMAEALHAVVHTYFDCLMERGASIRALLASSGSSPAIDEARERVWQQGVDRSARQIAQLTGARVRDLETVAEMGLSAAWSLAGRWLDGKISRKRAESLFVRTMQAWLTALHETADSRA
jgi:AcrR family transcriptional regulator